MMESEPEEYEKFFRLFGIQLKYGILASYGMAADTLKTFDTTLYRT